MGNVGGGGGGGHLQCKSPHGEREGGWGGGATMQEPSWGIWGGGGGGGGGHLQCRSPHGECGGGGGTYNAGALMGNVEGGGGGGGTYNAGALMGNVGAAKCSLVCSQ